jgi:hypothetical protein
MILLNFYVFIIVDLNEFYHWGCNNKNSSGEKSSDKQRIQTPEIELFVLH